MSDANYNASAALDAFKCGDYESVRTLVSPYAEAGNSDAQCMLALLYQCGLGVEQSVLESERWLLAATKQNNPIARHNLGALYDSKYPELEHRRDEAIKCYEMAKKLGFDCAEPYPPLTL